MVFPRDYNTFAQTASAVQKYLLFIDRSFKFDFKTTPSRCTQTNRKVASRKGKDTLVYTKEIAYFTPMSRAFRRSYYPFENKHFYDLECIMQISWK